MSKRTMRFCKKPRQLCPLKLRLRSGGSRKSIVYDSCDAASMIRTVLYFEFNSTAASRTKRWKNTGRYRVILIEPRRFWEAPDNLQLSNGGEKCRDIQSRQSRRCKNISLATAIT